jgi:hypothetical protein
LVTNKREKEAARLLFLNYERRKGIMVIYLSGAMANCKDTYKEKFAAAQERLESYNKNNTVINPAVLPTGLNPKSYMPICLAMLDEADIIHVIGDDWETSLGVKLEVLYALYQGKGIMAENKEILHRFYESLGVRVENL